MPAGKLPRFYKCAVCEWAAITPEEELPVANRIDAFSEHFASPRHQQNYVLWCRYREEQDIADDYVEEWLDQNSLLAVHKLCTQAPALNVSH